MCVAVLITHSYGSVQSLYARPASEQLYGISLVTRQPIALEIINRPSGETGCIYEAAVDTPLTDFNSQHGTAQFDFYLLVSVMLFLLHMQYGA